MNAGTWLPLVLAGLLGLASAGARGADRALLIGINEYRDVIPLQGAVNDVADFATLLQTVWGVPAASIMRLTDAQADRAAILRAMDEWLVGGSAPGDRIFFYYSGHGYFLPDQPGGDESGPGQDGTDEALVPYDATLDQAHSWRNLIRDDEIKQVLDRLPGRHLLVVVDSCHSGTMTRGGLDIVTGSKIPRLNRHSRGLGSEASKMIKIRTGQDREAHRGEGGFVKVGASGAGEQGLERVALFAVAPNQLALEDRDDPRRGGVFTIRLSKGIKDGAADADKDNRVTYAELIDYLRRESDAYCETHKRSCRQGLTPEMEAGPALLGRDVATFGHAGGGAPPSGPVAPGDVDDILVHSNEAGLTLSVLPRSRLRAGERMRVAVSARRPGVLVLLDLNAQGELYQLYPNPFVTERVCKGAPPVEKPGVRYFIPDDACPEFVLEMEPPYGTGRIVAVLIEDRDAVQVQDLTRLDWNWDPKRDPKRWLGRLRERLDRLVLQRGADGEPLNRSARWSVAWADYALVP